MRKHALLLLSTLVSFSAFALEDPVLLPGLEPSAPAPTLEELARPGNSAEASRSYLDARDADLDLSSRFRREDQTEALEGIEREGDLLKGVTNECRLQMLTALGWELKSEEGRTKFKVSSGNPCDNVSLAEARAGGELGLLTPPDRGATLDPEKVARFLNELLLSETSVCAYKFPVARAAMVAATRLSENENFDFVSADPMVQFWGNDIPWVGGCYSRRGTMQCFQGKYTPSRALHQFTDGKTATECAIGLQVGEFELQHQLYGDARFDQLFDRREIYIGPWSVVKNGTSATWGRSSHTQTLRDLNAQKAADMGARWFEGLSGYIGNVFGEGSLDSPVDRGENFLTVEVSQAAFQQIQQHGSFDFLNRKNREIWNTTRGMGDRARILVGNDENLDRYQMSSSLRSRIEKARKLLNEPVYTGYKVYVHPLKIMTFGEHIARLLRVNPRTAYEMTLYPSRIHGGLYRRYLKSLAMSCTQ